jgi:hypothetical protein
MKKLLLAGIAALSMLGASAAAEPDALGCFTRTYDRAHLARHPDQLITAVKLHIYEPPPDTSGGYYWFNAQFRVRGKGKPLRTTGVCSEELHCIVECDGGGVNVVPRASDAMMYLDRIRVATCGEDLIDGGQELTGGKDDRVFRLNRVNAAACTGMDIEVSKMLDRLAKRAHSRRPK